jgi:hypothetical protein
VSAPNSETLPFSIERFPEFPLLSKMPPVPCLAVGRSLSSRRLSKPTSLVRLQEGTTGWVTGEPSSLLLNREP